MYAEPPFFFRGYLVSDGQKCLVILYFVYYYPKVIFFTHEEKKMTYDSGEPKSKRNNEGSYDPIKREGPPFMLPHEFTCPIPKEQTFYHYNYYDSFVKESI